MRVAFVNQDPGVGPGRRKGASAHVAALQAALARVGAQVQAFELKHDAELELALAAAHAERPFECVYERYALGACAASRFARRCDLPHLLEVNAPLLEEACEQRGYQANSEDFEREREVFRAATWLLPVSRAVRDYVVERGAEPARVRVTPNAVDTRWFRPDAPRPADLRLPAGALVVGFHGRLRPWHNIELLVSSLERVLARGREVHVLAVGEGDFARALAPLGSQRWTQRAWMGAEQLAQHVACFDVLALTYAAERKCYFSPLKLFEAMACGVAPIVPALGELPELVEHGACGAVVPAGDAQALSELLVRWCDDRSEWQRLGAAAACKAAQRSWDDVAREVLACAQAAQTP